MRRWLSQCSHCLPLPPGAARCKSPLHNSLYLGLWRRRQWRRRRRGCWGICARPFNRKGAGSIEKHYTATFFQGRRKPLYNWNTNIVELSLLIAAAAAVAAWQARRRRCGGRGLPHASEAFLLKAATVRKEGALQEAVKDDGTKSSSAADQRRRGGATIAASTRRPVTPPARHQSKGRWAVTLEVLYWCLFFYTYPMWRKMKIDYFLFFPPFFTFCLDWKLLYWQLHTVCYIM